jgi:peptidoglycan/LPS O-acetylase OafA/YrhL
MNAIGGLIGALCYYFQDSVIFPDIRNVSVSRMVGISLLGMALIPIPPSMDIRGCIEMYPLNGPAWTLFYDYVASFLYAFGVRKCSNTVLSGLVFLGGCATLALALNGPRGDLVGGWALNPMQLVVGLTRMSYPFFCGLLLARTAKPRKIPHAFAICSVLIVTIMAIPRIGGRENVWMNGLYEAVCVLVLFPLIVYLGANAETLGNGGARLCQLIGELSFSVYITHYGFIYIYTAWVSNEKRSVWESFQWGVVTFVTSVAVGYACLKLYDQPVRQWLQKNWQ